MDGVTKALEDVANATGAERLSERLEAAIDPATNALLVALAAELSGDGNARTMRSRAARELLRRGALALREDRARKARALASAK